MSDKVRVSISVSPNTKERLKLFAEANDMTVSDAASWLLEDAMKRIAPTEQIKESIRIKKSRPGGKW